MPEQAKGDKVELRGWIPRHVMDVIDAVAIARRMPRATLVTQILDVWVQEQMREADLIGRVAGAKATRAASGGGEA